MIRGVVVVSIGGGDELLKARLVVPTTHDWKSRRFRYFLQTITRAMSFIVLIAFSCFPRRCPRLTRGAPSARKARM